MLHLCSVCVVKRAQSENAVFSIARTRCRETQCSLFPIYSRLPKLDVAGSTPVSRSRFDALQNARSDIDIMRRRLEADVLLVKALGGGWNVSSLPQVAALK